MDGHFSNNLFSALLISMRLLKYRFEWEKERMWLEVVHDNVDKE